MPLRGILSDSARRWDARMSRRDIPSSDPEAPVGTPLYAARDAPKERYLERSSEPRKRRTLGWLALLQSEPV